MCRTLIAAAAALTIATSHSLAQPFAGNDADFGPGSVTVDPSQGLEFLDLTVTQGVSLSTMATQLLPGGTYEDWRYATPSEVATLLNEFGWSPPITSVFANNETDQFFFFVLPLILNDFLGVTFSDTFSRQAYGYFQDGRAVVVSRNEFVFRWFAREALPPNPSVVGHWLVRGAMDVAPTYQGRLTEMGTPFDGPADFRVTLISSSGDALGTIEHTAVPVEAGLFTIPLDFDAMSLGSIGVRLRIETRAPSGVGDYDLLASDQPVVPTPRALRSRSAESADFASTAATALTLSNKASVPLSLAAGTEPYGRGYRSPVVSRSGNQVILNGLVGDVGISNAEGTVFATLPVGFRPTARLLFLQASSAGVYRVDVLPNGQLQFLGLPGVGGAIDWVSLDGISFTLD